MKKRKYKCWVCGTYYERDITLTYIRWCSRECRFEYCFPKAKKNLNKSRTQKKKKQREELKTLSEWKADLQRLINWIVRKIDEDKPCIARPNSNGLMTAGHLYSVGSYPALRYHLWNIHKQSTHSNSHLSGDTSAYRQGIIIRYGESKLEYIDSLRAKYPVLKLSIPEIKDKIVMAKHIKSRLNKGEIITRDEINNELSIYK